ncbi:MAG: endopeptidase La [Candidatus Midichloria sp.]|nr:MAG: endopeptidase La [Candidatus Midichloria sp.]
MELLQEIQYPVLPLRDLVMFPDMIVPLFVGREKSIKALEYAASIQSKILLVAQRDAANDNPKLAEIYKIGVISKILQFSKVQEPTIKIFVQGLERVKVTKFSNNSGILLASTILMPDEEYNAEAKEVLALRRTVGERFEEYVKMNKKINPEILNNISQIKRLEDFCNAINAHMILSVDKKQDLLSITSLPKRLEKTLLLIDSETEMLKTESRIKARVKTQIEKNQKDYYLNEQLKAIHKELGDDDQKEELNELEKKIKHSHMSKEAKERAQSEIKKLKMMNSMSSEAAVIRNYLDWLTEIPWQVYSPMKKNLKAAQDVLDADHYGLEKIKEHILEYLAVNLRTQELKSPIICFVGPPGVGKTSLAKSIAKATGRNFIKISLGGLRDEAEIRGHRRTYIGAMPGKIIQAMKKAKNSNPVILLDEIDKMSFDHRGDPASALLEILDPKQNVAFNDHYLEVDYDLSKVMFIATANSTYLPRPLLDRLEIITLSGYTEDEKMGIAQDYLLPKQSSVHGVKNGEVSIENEAILSIICYYTRESGVRQLDRDLAKIIRKCIKRILLEKEKCLVVNNKNLKDFLGAPRFTYGEIAAKNRIGIANGLAYTDFGGDLLEVEAVVFHGKGDIKITGKLGDVMRESVQAAFSFIRSKALDFGINPEIFKEKDIHVHVPEGATPKDGPSAGVAICISIVSALTNIPVFKDIAVTGEITLSGRVLGIGGLKEKLLSALRGGVKTVMIPKENLKDLEEMPQKVRENLNIVPLESAEEALKIALEGKLLPVSAPLAHSSTQGELVPKAH